MSRPGGHVGLQRARYSVHNRFYCMVYQTVTTPDGLIYHFYGPEVGKKHDMTLFQRSGFPTLLSTCLYVNGKQYALFEDSAYIMRSWLQVGLPSVIATVAQGAFNTEMSGVREAAERSYKDLKQM